jgi:hypothetical protein
MSKQTGLFRMTGKIGGVIFYQSNGVDLARVANGPTKERIGKDPNFARTRENNSEFGGCARVVKAIRLAVGERKTGKGDVSRTIQRLMPIVKRINLSGSGGRGRRSIEVVNHGTLLEDFDFNEREPFASVFNAPYTIVTAADRNKATISVPAFLPSSCVAAPAGATHFELFSVLCTVSNYAYDAGALSYAPVEPTLNMLSGSDHSAVTELSVTTPVTFTLNPQLADAPTMTADVAAVLLLGVQFVQRTGPIDYLLSKGDCLKIVKVF